MRASLAKNWFLFALAVCYVVGYAGADLLRPLLDASWLRSGVVFVVMWAMGVTLHAGSLSRSLHRPLPSLLAIAVNAAVIPLLCLPAIWLFASLLSRGNGRRPRLRTEPVWLSSHRATHCLYSVLHRAAEHRPFSFGITGRRSRHGRWRPLEPGPQGLPFRKTGDGSCPSKGIDGQKSR